MLDALMRKYGSDKADHGYCEFYEGHFAPIRESVKAFLEIGVFKGASARAWLDYFPVARVLGLDDGHFRAKWSFGTDRAQVYIGDQGARSSLKVVAGDNPGGFDIVLDDGSHTMWGQQVSLAGLLPSVKTGGLYVLEDLHTSFSPVVGYRWPNGVLYGYATGCDFPLTTTHEVLSKWPDVKSDYMTQDEWDYCVAHVGKVEIFDRDNDKKHMTAVLEVAK